MELLTNPNKIERAFSRLINRYKHVSFAVAWASTGFPGYELLVRQETKIQKGIIGTHFYQTDPKFIDHFLSDERVLFVKQPNGVFHPKVFLFENSPNSWECLLGSANFTSGGFNSNNEICILLGDRDDKEAIIKMGLDLELTKYWKMGKRFEKDELEYYRELHSRGT
jgi:HKD family nuclease